MEEADSEAAPRAATAVHLSHVKHATHAPQHLARSSSCVDGSVGATGADSNANCALRRGFDDGGFFFGYR